MGERLTEAKVQMLRKDGSIRNFYTRMSRNGQERIPLGRLYRLIGGYNQPTQEEKRLLSQYLQLPASQLFPEA